MIWAGVKHHAKHNKTYWFCVPRILSHYVEIGDTVICNTKHGNAEGEVVALINSQQLKCNFSPTRSIIAIKKIIKIDNIIIPERFYRSTPRSSKIAARIREYNRDFDFHTRVVARAVTEDICELEDGYTAFLVAKMFEDHYLYGYVTAYRNAI